MANNPLDSNEFRHYLIFHSLGRTDLYEICEPDGFDASNFVQEQESKRYARSVEYGSVDKITFIDAFGKDTGVNKAINILGDEDSHLEYGLQYLLYIYKTYGFQSKVEYILEKNGVQFSVGMLDFTEKNITDGYSYITTKLIQKNKVANLKRRLDDKFNLFGTVNANNETITPAPTIDFLLKATPITNLSVWEQNQPILKTAGTLTGTFNPARNVREYGINNTLTPFLQDSSSIQSSFSNAVENFKYIKAKNDITNLRIEEDCDIDFHYEQSGGNSNSKAILQLWYAIWQGTDFDFSQEYGVLYQKELSGTATQNFNLKENLVFNFPVVQRDYNFSIFWAFTYDTEHINKTTWNFKKANLKATGTETALNTVVKGVRWIDGIKQADKFVSNIGVDASLFDIGGLHYNNVIFGKRQISQKTDIFNTSCKAVYESVEEVNCDYEPTEEKIFIGHHKDFYENQEIAYFDIIPDEDFNISENERHQINKFQYKYKDYQQDRTVLQTSKAIHTETEYRLLNDQVENVKEIALDFTRDPYSIQAMVDLEISSPTTSTSEDDKVYISEITNLAPSSFNEFGARLLMRITDGKLEILNRDSNGDSNNVVINWLILGFKIGDTIRITFGENQGAYTATNITNSVLTLTPQSGTTPDYNGDAFIRIKFYYTDVLYVTRTSEGFISNPLNLQNAKYSIHRNITNYFSEYLASCDMYEKKDIINGYFKSNGDYTSQLNTEANPVIEKSNILFSSLINPLITPKIYQLTCQAEFNDILNYLETYKTKRGFIRTYDSKGRVIKGFIKKLNHLWLENKLTLTLEEKYETEYLILTYSDNILTVDDVVYDLSGNSDWWRFDNDYIKLYDNNNKPLSNYYKYNFVKLNGIIYSSKEDLVNALLNL